MIGVPQPNPRDSIIAQLDQQLTQFFCAGKSVQQVAAGVTGDKEGPISSTRSNKLRATRDREAPGLRQLADSGHTLLEAARITGTEPKRARLIARENGIKFKS